LEARGAHVALVHVFRAVDNKDEEPNHAPPHRLRGGHETTQATPSPPGTCWRKGSWKRMHTRSKSSSMEISDRILKENAHAQQEHRLVDPQVACGGPASRVLDHTQLPVFVLAQKIFGDLLHLHGA